MCHLVFQLFEARLPTCELHLVAVSDIGSNLALHKQALSQQDRQAASQPAS